MVPIDKPTPYTVVVTVDMDSARTEGKRKPRKLMKVNESICLSKYMQNNRKYWNDVFHKVDTYKESAVSRYSINNSYNLDEKENKSFFFSGR